MYSLTINGVGNALGLRQNEQQKNLIFYTLIACVSNLHVVISRLTTRSKKNCIRFN